MTAQVAEPLASMGMPWSCPAGQAVKASGADRREWLAARKSLVGGSEVAMVFGTSPYGGPYTVWADKLGLSPEREQTVAMARGLDFEDAIIEHWRHNYADFPILVRRQGLMRSRSHPHAGATVDRLSVCSHDGQPHRCLIEVKSQVDMSEWADGEVPAAFQMQALWQLAVTGREHVHFVVLGPRFTVEHRLIERDEELQLAMLDRVERWWGEYVATEVAPEPDSSDLDALRRVHRKATKGEVREVDDELAPHVQAMLDAKAEIDTQREVYDTAVAHLQAAMGTATELVWPGEDGELVATWRQGKTIDGCNADFRRARPELVARYEVPTTEVDVKKLAENEPELLATGQLRYRRTWTVK